MAENNVTVTRPVRLEKVDQYTWRLPEQVNRNSMIVMLNGRPLTPVHAPSDLWKTTPWTYQVNGRVVNLNPQGHAENVTVMWTSGASGNAPPSPATRENAFTLNVYTGPGGATAHHLVIRNGKILYGDEYQTDYRAGRIYLNQPLEDFDVVQVSRGWNGNAGFVPPVRVERIGPGRYVVPPQAQGNVVVLYDGEFAPAEDYTITARTIEFKSLPAFEDRVAVTWVEASLPEGLVREEEAPVELTETETARPENDRYRINLDDQISFDDLPGGTDDDTVASEDPMQVDPPPVSPIPIPQSNDDEPCMAFPRLNLPSLSFRLPEIPGIELCIPAYGPTFIGGRLSEYLTSPESNKVKYDHGDPKVQPKEGGETVVTTPADPQHISKEIAKVAPLVSQEVMDKFTNNLLVSLNTTAANVQGFINVLIQKAEALGDGAARALGEGLANAMNGLESVEDFGAWMANGGIDAVNQAAAMVPYSQIPVGIRDPLSLATPELRLFTDAATNASFVLNQGVNSAISMLNNGLAIVTDLYNQSFGLCLGRQAAWRLSEAANFNLQGLHIPSFGAQLDGLARMMVLQPFHINGIERTPQSWRFSCADLNRQTERMVTSLRDFTDKLTRHRQQGGTGAMPGNLLYAAYGDNAEALEADFMLKLPLRIAMNLNSPYLSEIQRYTQNADAQYDSMTSILPDLILSGDPRIARLLKALQALQGVIIFVNSLIPAEVRDLEQNSAEVGGSLVAFVKKVQDNDHKLGPLDRIASNYIANRLTMDQQFVLTDLAGAWDELVVDPTAIKTSTRRKIAEAIINPRKEVLGAGERLAVMMTGAPEILNVFGGHLGTEVAYVTALFAALLRMQLLANQPDIEQRVVIERAGKILKDAERLADEITFAGPYGGYVKAMSAVAAAGGSLPEMVEAGMPSAVEAAQKLTEHQHMTMAASNEQMAQQQGKRSADIHEAANEIDFTKENNDTQAFVAGALDRHNTSIKAVVTKSIPNVGGAASAVSQAGISAKPDDRAKHVEKIIKETSNALASTTLNKTTGAKLNQQYEGAINQAKFILNQAGTSLTQEAPVIRSAGRLVVNQGQVILNEGDSLDYRGQWAYHLLEHSWGVATEDSHILSKGLSVITSKKAHYFGQEETVISDKDHLKINAGNASQILMAKDGSLVASVGDVTGPKGGIKLTQDGTLTASNSESAQITLKPDGSVRANAGDGAQIKLNKSGTITQKATNKVTTAAKVIEVSGDEQVVIVVGGAAIVITNGRIDLNPSSIPSVAAPSVEPTEAPQAIDQVEVLYTEAPAIEKTTDRVATVLPSKGARNPVPCAAPYKRPSDPA